jgi:GTP cyclohydrolase I
MNSTSEKDLFRAEVHVETLLHELGVDMTTVGREKTAKRYTKFLEEFLNPATFELTTFPSEGYKQWVMEQNISFYSLCEHHLLPFFGTATIAYMPSEKVIGISKLARIVEMCSSGLQMQERLTKEIAGVLEDALQPRGVAVTLKARHLCQEMRGARAMGAETTTTYFTGIFMDKQQGEGARREFLQLTNA